MKSIRFTILGLCLATLLVANALPAMATPASTRVPRVGLVGDSWSSFLWWFNSFRLAMNSGDFPTCVGYTDVANESSVAGSKAFEFLAEDRIEAMRNLLLDNPTLDVVVLSMGGNDMLSGSIGVLEGDPDRKVRWRCPCDPCETETDGMHPSEWNNLLFQTISANIQNMIDVLLSVRPDVRILLTSYDYGGEVRRGECSLEDQQLGFVELGLAKQALADANDRVYFLNNYGLMQWHYGVDPTDGLPEGLPAQDPSIPYPSTQLNLENPGGLPQYLSPFESLLDNEIHLNEGGYNILAHRAVDEFIAEWMDYPKAFEIIPVTDSKAEQYQFQVTFSEAVSGVDITDFEVTTATVAAKIDISTAAVVSVSPSEGPAKVYTVTVDMNPAKKDIGTQDVVSINVVDDDSIVDGDNNPLGGPNTDTWTDNGKFTYYGPFAFVEFDRPTPGNFDEAQSYLGGVISPYLPMLNHAVDFAADSMDINGDIYTLLNSIMGGDDVDTDTLYVYGNGILESYEFGLIDYCLKHPELDLSDQVVMFKGKEYPGISSSAVQTLWAANLAQMQEDLGGTEDNMLLELLAGFDTLFAGYCTLGDPGFMDVLSMLTWYLSDAGAEDLAAWFPGVEFQMIDTSSYEPHPEWFSPNADPDGDGFTNGEELLYFECDGKEAVAAASFDANLSPTPLLPTYNAGDSVRLYIPEYKHVKSTYQWFKDGVALVDGPNVSGATGRILKLSNLSDADNGAYTCEWDDQNPHTKGTGTYGPIVLSVGPAEEDLSALLKTLLQSFSTLDTNADGELSLAEIQVSFPSITENFVKSLSFRSASSLIEHDLLLLTGSDEHHSIDTDDDGVVSLSELLRVIQIFNFEAFSCATTIEETEDGYLPGSSDEDDFTCVRHTLDYDSFDWKINLTELLRAIQFYNANGLHACPDEDTEDGYCLGQAN